MDVILLERIEKLGKIGDVVKVKTGFARNYLLPQKKALRATKANLEYFETQRARLEALNAERLKDASGEAGSLDGFTVTLVRQASETGQLYGSASARDISDAIDAAGHKVERRMVQLDQPIKVLGLHKVRVALHPEVVVTVTVNVARSPEEAQLQIERGGAVIGTAPIEAEPEVEAEAEDKPVEAKPVEAKPVEAKPAEAAAEAQPEAEAEPEAPAKKKRKAKAPAA
jgi:large subunit ribosomal protein L9